MEYRTLPGLTWDGQIYRNDDMGTLEALLPTGGYPTAHAPALLALPDGSLLITGGDTLMECMKRLGVSQMEPIGELSAGVVYSRFSYHQSDYCVISKSGGFGGENLIPELCEILGSDVEINKGIPV